MPSVIKNIAIEGGTSLPAPYNGFLKIGGTIVVEDDVDTVITNLGGPNVIQGGLSVSVAPAGASVTPNSTLADVLPQIGIVDESSDQTITGTKTFTEGALKIENDAGTHSVTLHDTVTADRTIAFPDFDGTLAKGGVATGTTAPAFTGTGSGGAITPVTGATVGWSGNTATQSAGGATAAADALAGGFIDDGTNTAVIISNTTCTPTSGTITVKPLSKLPAPTGTTVTIVPPPIAAGTVASHTHTQS